MPKNTRLQTIIIAIVCVLGVAYAGYSVYQQKNSVRDIQAPEISGTQEDLSDPGYDWKKFFSSGTESTSSAVTKNTKSQTSSESLTSTDIFARTFLTGYAKLKEAGLTDDEESIQKINDQILEQSIANIPTPKSYKLTDVSVTNVFNTESLAKYGKEVTAIVAKQIPVKNEAEIALEAMSSGNYALLKNIDPIIYGYKYAVNSLLSMTVPSAVSTYHLNLINGLSIQVYNAESLRISDKDPLRGLAAASMEIQGLRAIYTAIGDIKNYLISAGVSIESTPDLPINN